MDDIQGVLIGVINFGQGPNHPWPPRKNGKSILMEPTWLYGTSKGPKPYTYLVSEPGKKEPVINVVPLEVAYFHCAVELDPVTGTLRRANVPKDDDDSWFDNRVSSLCPKIKVKRYPDEPFDSTHNPFDSVDDPAWIDWYTNGVTFKMRKLNARMTAEEFMRA
jgi:hypothetical protein